VESASLDEIKSVEGVEEKVAKKIYNFFHEWNLKFQII
jgi:excinuclease ABC subunit C